MPPDLSELTPITLNVELTHLGSKASICIMYKNNCDVEIYELLFKIYNGSDKYLTHAMLDIRIYTIYLE